MTRLLLVRHAHPSADWSGDVDAGLDALGARQAEALVDGIGAGPPCGIVSSPLRRTRETAAPLAAHWDVTPEYDDAVGEIASPIDDLGARGAWLRDVLTRRWPEVDAELRAWREGVVRALAERREDCVIVTHYVAINAAVGSALGDDRLVVFSPGHTSITELDVVDDQLELVRLGAQAPPDLT